MAVVATTRRGTARMAAVLVATLAFGAAIGPGGPVAHAAMPPTGLLAAPADDEGGTPALRDQLDAASTGWIEAKNALEKSTKRQQELNGQLKTIEADLVVRNGKVGEIAGVAYRTGRLGAAQALLNTDSPARFLDRAATLDSVAANEDRELRQLLETRDKANRTKLALDGELREQRKQVDTMAKRKEQAERALEVAVRQEAREKAEERERAQAQERARANSGGGSSGGSSSGPGGSSSKTAKAAPRNSDGSWPKESCSVNDPTPANGCITPRTLHALNQAKAAGFTRYVSCYRPGGSGEHPRGRACDFAAQKGGFGGDATGGDRTYGNNLAAYYVRNADKLAVLYVIWYRQIWLPSSGWKSYSGAGGDPSSDHTNHVHLSVY
ncbi:coiled-coil domain-containing protein [Micromonospora sp. WMMA1923]|uniref:coiled-coil domain-containing protein n=1 Tax=Micromonospora sp. WMMA1923 TaxID=3404125 RepID=UPI003B948C41